MMLLRSALLASSVGLAACATMSAKQDVVRQRAAFDLQCDGPIQVASLNSRMNNNTVLGASGCGRQATYVVQCGDFAASCTAIKNSETDETVAASPKDDTPESETDSSQ